MQYLCLRLTAVAWTVTIACLVQCRGDTLSPRGSSVPFTFVARKPAALHQTILFTRGGADDVVADAEGQNDDVADTSREGQQSINKSSIEEPDALKNEREDEETESLRNQTNVSPNFDASDRIPAVMETTTVLHHTVDLGEDVHEDEELSSGGKEDQDSSLATISQEEADLLVEMALEIRAAGKELHDDQEYQSAAAKFSEAAQILYPIVMQILDQDEEEETSVVLIDEYATCRLHESLCLLKAESYEEAKRACSEVLELSESESTDSSGPTPALRARAFYRRAKAELELGETAEALYDARSAAFLGDNKAVALYGKLMRESSPASSLPHSDVLGDMTGSNALFESLLNKSSNSGASNDVSTSPLNGMESMLSSSLLNSLMGSTGGLGSGGENGGEGAGSLAKSVLSSLSKKIDDEENQERICNFLQGTSGPQLQQMAGFAGLQLDGAQSSKIAAICQGVTPTLFRRYLKLTKRVIYVVGILRKVLQLTSKYQTIIILVLIVAWAKSAILRPIPVSKRAAKKLAQQSFAAFL